MNKETPLLAEMCAIGETSLNDIREQLNTHGVTSADVRPIYEALVKELDRFKANKLTHGQAIGAALFLLMGELTLALFGDEVEALYAETSATEPPSDTPAAV